MPQPQARWGEGAAEAQGTPEALSPWGRQSLMFHVEDASRCVTVTGEQSVVVGEAGGPLCI